jgi:hypothetical protein
MGHPIGAGPGLENRAAPNTGLWVRPPPHPLLVDHADSVSA